MFTRGQRVKRIAGHPEADYRGAGAEWEGAIIEQAPTFTPGVEPCWYVNFDNGHSWACWQSSLRPLTDGETNAWAADAVRKLVKPEPVAPPLPVKEKAL